MQSLDPIPAGRSAWKDFQTVGEEQAGCSATVNYLLWICIPHQLTPATCFSSDLTLSLPCHSLAYFLSLLSFLLLPSLLLFHVLSVLCWLAFSSLLSHRREPLAVDAYLSQHQHRSAPCLFACLRPSIQHQLSFLINLTAPANWQILQQQLSGKSASASFSVARPKQLIKCWESLVLKPSQVSKVGDPSDPGNGAGSSMAPL